MAPKSAMNRKKATENFGDQYFDEQPEGPFFFENQKFLNYSSDEVDPQIIYKCFGDIKIFTGAASDSEYF